MQMSVTSSARLPIHGCFVLNVPRACWFGLYHKMYWVEYNNVSPFSTVTEMLFHNLKYIFPEPGYVARALWGLLESLGSGGGRLASREPQRAV